MPCDSYPTNLVYQHSKARAWDRCGHQILLWLGWEGECKYNVQYAMRSSVLWLPYGGHCMLDGPYMLVAVLSLSPAVNTVAICCCHKPFSQWECSFHWKLHCHWLKGLKHCQIIVVIQGPGVKNLMLCNEQCKMNRPIPCLRKQSRMYFIH